MYGDKDETVNHIVSDCSKLAQRSYKARHNWVGKVIHWELCKKLNFHHATKWYTHKPESVLENETHKILWDFEIQMDHQIPARRPDLVVINKKERTYHLVDFSATEDHRVKLREIEKEDKYLARELKKLWNMRVKVVPIINGALGTVPKDLEKSLSELVIKGIIETIQTTGLLKSARIIIRVLET